MSVKIGHASLNERGRTSELAGIYGKEISSL